jgi:hypothetical protein
MLCKTAWKNNQLIGEYSVKADHVETNNTFFNVFTALKLEIIKLEVDNFRRFFKSEEKSQAVNHNFDTHLAIV